jgi:hypothetical protein
MCLDLDRPPRWLHTLAYDVHALVDQEGGMVHFRATIWNWMEGLEAINRQIESREQARMNILLESHNAYAYELLHAPTCEPRGWAHKTETLYRVVEIPLQLRSCDRDEFNDWVTSLALTEPESFGPHRNESELPPHHIEIRFEFGTWIPPDLSAGRDPKIDDLLPLPDRALTVEEGYAVLAAIHDQVTRGVAKIDPWEQIHEGDSIESILARAKQGHLHYLRLRDAVARLGDTDEARLRPILASTAVELEEATLTLNDRERRILRVLWEREAFSQDVAIKKPDVVDHAAGKGTNVDSYEDDFARLKELRLFATRRGPTGGAWLESRGKIFCRKSFQN